MKVKIGKFPGRLTSNLFRNYMDKKYSYIWPKERDYTTFEKYLEKVEDFLQEVYHPFNKLFFDRREQKVKVRIDPWDTWNMDGTLGHIVLPMLVQLRETKHGAPFVEYEDAPEHLRPTQEEIDNLEVGSTDEFWFDRWDWVMGEMIFAFESLHNDGEEQFYSGEHDMVTVPVDYDGNEVAKEDAQLFRWDKGPNDTFEIDWEGMKAYNQRIDNGFRLFGKYFRGLWD